MRGQLADLVLLNDPANLSKFREQGPAEYMPHAFRPSVHYPRRGPRDPDLVSDLAFIGTAFKSRIEFFEQMDLDGIDFLLGGADWGSIDPASSLVPYVGSGLTEADCVDNQQTATLYRNALTGINFYRRESEDTWDGEAVACGPREIELAACGVPFLRDPRPESDQLFPMLPSFDGPGDASEKLRWMLSHPDEREDMARQAREAVQNRTFLHNARRLLTILDSL